MHAWVLARGHRTKAWDYFLDVLQSDVADSQGGTTQEGIHLGAMAGTVDLLQRAFTGLETRDGQLWLDPRLPDGLGRLSFRLSYRGHRDLYVDVDHRRVVLSGLPRLELPLRVRVRGREYEVDPAGAREVALHET